MSHLARPFNKAWPVDGKVARQESDVKGVKLTGAKNRKSLVGQNQKGIVHALLNFMFDWVL